MLTTNERPAVTPIRPSYARRLWDDRRRNPSSLGCPVCPNRRTCGGLHVRAAIMDCHQFCCGKPDRCTQVCRNNADYVDRVREIVWATAALFAALNRKTRRSITSTYCQIGCSAVTIFLRGKLRYRTEIQFDMTATLFLVAWTVIL
jgi:hypothetical protein